MSFLSTITKAFKAAQKASREGAAASPAGRERPPQVVRVAYRELNRPAPDWDPADLERGYAYLWPFSTPPAIGERVVLETAHGQHGVVVGFGTKYRGDLLPVHRVVSQTEIDAAISKAAADEDAWLEMARRAAGLPSQSRRTRVPPGFPTIAPVDGQASADAAGTYGSMWWRVFKTAKSRGWPKDEVQRVESIARRWYAVRDKGGN